MTETWQQQRFFQSIAHALKASPTPLLLHLDDLQWSDAETFTLLQFLLHGARRIRYSLWVVFAPRTPAIVVSWLHRSDARRGSADELQLGLLSADVAANWRSRWPASPSIRKSPSSFIAASEGHPLYVIEAVRSEQAPPLALPAATPIRPTTPTSRTGA